VAAYATGSVTVHWTDPTDRSQSYIPMASPFVTKLATLAARAHVERPFDVIYSHYLEPYGVAAYLASQMTGVPHVARMAGSDAGRLWHHPQFELVYDHVLRSAEAVIAVGAVAERAAQRGVSSERIVAAAGFIVPEDLFTPEGIWLNIPQLRAEVDADPALRELMWGNFVADRPYFGIYGKLGERKGSFALLAAMHRLMSAGVEVGLVALAHGAPTVEKAFRAQASELGLADRILQIPFLPHWRVPEFLRGCLAVCCLEQGFPIEFHTPGIPREVLLCGACLVGSTEVIRKLPSYERLPHGYGCIAIEDVNNTDVLCSALAAIGRNPQAARAIGARGRQFALELQRNYMPLQALERIFEAAAGRQKMPAFLWARARHAATEAAESRFPLTQIVIAATRGTPAARYLEDVPLPPERAIDTGMASRILSRLEEAIREGHAAFQPFAAAIRIEMAIVAAENAAGESSPADSCDSLFRLQSLHWCAAASDLAGLFPMRDPQLRIIEFDCDIESFLGVRTAADFPAVMAPGPSYIVAFRQSNHARREPLLIDAATARILMLSDGTRTSAAILEEFPLKSKVEPLDLAWIENMFVRGLISVHEKPVDHGIGSSPVGPDCATGHNVWRKMALGGRERSNGC
jgi:glycosyltransferase involved in cell wall biosynthesis